MAKKKALNLVTITEYAIKCGVSEARIYQRIKEGLLIPVRIRSKKGKGKGTMFVDLATTPVLGEHRGRKSADELLRSAYADIA